jgi:hypothetical protein
LHHHTTFKKETHASQNKWHCISFKVKKCRKKATNAHASTSMQSTAIMCVTHLTPCEQQQQQQQSPNDPWLLTHALDSTYNGFDNTQQKTINNNDRIRTTTTSTTTAPEPHHHHVIIIILIDHALAIDCPALPMSCFCCFLLLLMQHVGVCSVH